MKIYKLIVGLILAFIVSTINGISGIGYTVGGEFEISLQAAVDDKVEDDSRWKTQGEDTESYLIPRDRKSALILLLESKFGRLGLFLQVLCLLQFIGGLMVVIRSSTRAFAFVFLIMIAFAGVAAEIIGAYFSSTWGVTNIIGIGASVMLLQVAFYMYRATGGQGELQDTA